MRRTITFAVVILLAAMLCSCSSGPKSAQTARGIPTVIQQGTPEQMGQAHGHALGESIRTLHAQYISRWIRNDAQRSLAMTVAGVFESMLSPEHRKELIALAKAANADEKQTMLANCFLDLSPMTACSTITLPASASPDGVARFGRDLDFPSFDIADNASVLLIYRPAGKYAFASIGWPGLIGVLSGMNEHGLALANMEVTRSSRPPTAVPYTVLYRTVLEQCKTVNEVIELIRTTPRQTENNLMVMDATGDRAVIEIYTDHVDVRRAGADKPLISTNHRRCNQPDVAGRCSRYDSLEKTARQSFGRVDVPLLQHMLTDASAGDMTLQSMIFEPSTLTLYLATGKNAPTKPMQKIALRPMLQP